MFSTGALLFNPAGEAYDAPLGGRMGKEPLPIWTGGLNLGVAL